MKKIFGVLILFQLITLATYAQQETTSVKISGEKIIVDGKKFYLHHVEGGQTLYSIARAYHVDSKEIMIHNPQLADGLKAGSTIKIPVQSLVEEPNPGEVSDTVNFHYIEIRRKHTLYSLSKQYNVTIQEIYDANPGLEERGLKRKDVIRIPKHSIQAEKIDFTDPALQRDSSRYIYHTVKAGETLYSLGRKYQLGRDRITDANPELLERNLRRGEVIRIPKQDVQFVISFPSADDTVKASVGPVNSNDSIPLDYHIDSLRLGARDSITVLLLLPFNAEANLKSLYNQERSDKELQLYPVSQMMVQFYEGFLSGMSQLDLKGKILNLKVYDTEMKPDVVRQILEDQINPPDLIIGPVNQQDIELCLKYGMLHSVPVIAPVEPDSESLFAYPNLISIDSNRRLRNELLASWLYQREDNIVIVHDGSSKSVQAANAMKTEIMDYFSMKDVADEYDVKLFHYTTKNQSDLKSAMSEQDTNCVLAVSDDKVYITSMINTLYQCNDSEIRLFGDKSWLGYNNVSVEEFRKLKFSYISPMYINYSDTLAFEFIELYRDQFWDEPGYYAFMGYDVASLILPSVFKYGADLQAGLLASDCLKGFSMEWEFMQNHSSQPLLNTRLMLIGLNENYELLPFFRKNP